MPTPSSRRRGPLQRLCVNFVVGGRLIKKRRFAAVVRSATSSGARVRRRGRDRGARATVRLRDYDRTRDYVPAQGSSLVTL